MIEYLTQTIEVNAFFYALLLMSWLRTLIFGNATYFDLAKKIGIEGRPTFAIILFTVVHLSIAVFVAEITLGR